MKVTMLGTGSPLPDPHRAGPATLVEAGGKRLLVDCGRGVVMRLAAAGVLPGMLDALLLTHLHSDHITDLNDLITTRWAMSQAPSPLTIVGPPGTARVVERTLTMLADDIGYRHAHHEDLTWDPDPQVTEVLDGTAWEAGDVVVTAAPTDHRPVHPTIGFRFDHAGAAAVVAGDTVPCDGLHRLCLGASVYVQTVVRADLVALVPMRRFQDILDYHSSVQDAARTAAAAGVETLVLTHLVPPPAPGTEAEWIAQAAEHFGGRVVLASDLDAVEL